MKLSEAYAANVDRLDAAREAFRRDLETVLPEGKPVDYQYPGRKLHKTTSAGRFRIPERGLPHVAVHGQKPGTFRWVLISYLTFD